MSGVFDLAVIHAEYMFALQLQCKDQESIMRTATFPVVRTTPETRAFVEAALRHGETLSTFIEESVLERAKRRNEDDEFYARAIAASKRVDSGEPTISSAESYARLKAIAEEVKRNYAQRGKAAP